MSLVDRINRAVLKRMGRTPASVEGDAIRLGGERIPLRELAGAVAHEVDVHAGTAVALTLLFPGGRAATLTAEEACWVDLLAALDRLALTAVPSRDWVTAVVAGDAAAAPIVLRGDGRSPS